MALDSWGILSNVMRTRRLKSPSDPMPVAGLPGPGHRTVLLHEAMELLALKPSDVVVDGTLGGAGHSREVAKKLGPKGTLVCFDADSDAIDRGKKTLEHIDADVHFVHGNFRHIRTELEKLHIPKIDKALFDLGWSGFQLSAGRGFSFLTDEPLSMAYDKDQALNASVVVNEWKEESLADIIWGWGEERFARRIARAICESREEQPIRTSRELAGIVKTAVPAKARFGRIHPATKTFQAIRIAVNDELGALEEAIRNTWQVLEEGGRIAVISFHSLEDRIVKQRFLDLEKQHGGIRITRKPTVPGEKELAENPRARSAKLRVIEKALSK